MDIQKASNYEINKAVAATLGYVVKAQIGKHGFVFIENPDFDIGHEGVDYCNQWEDAGPIIQDNKIDLIHNHDNGTCTASAMVSGNELYDFEYEHESPLVAAMTVYLMIKEADRARRQESP